ncbi:MAG TPA: hypothetical protein VMT46_01965 [Anaerolineaceae bacterium]|nr:hypothetical protein [Anaerolineaceae bacterium]
MLIDDAGDPTLRTLEMLAVKTIQEGWEGRVTTRAAEALNLSGHALVEGGNADLVILNANSVWEAIWSHEAPLHVVKDGVEVKI